MIMSLGVVGCNKALRRMRLNAIRTAKWPVITRRSAREFTNVARPNERLVDGSASRRLSNRQLRKMRERKAAFTLE